MLVVNPSGYREVIPLECFAYCVEPQGLVEVPFNGLISEVRVRLGL